MRPDKLIRSNRKTIALQIDENARLIVRAPYLASLSRINSFIEEKSGWIFKKKQQVIQRNKDMEENRQFRDGKRVLFLGRDYEIRLNGKIKNILLQDGFMEFPFGRMDSADEFLAMWYKKQAKAIIIPQVERFADLIGLRYSKIGITGAQKRWGSCNAKGSLNFSYRLVMAPPEIIDYVIVHELMHLKELNHSEKFWALVEEIIPDHKARRKWLKNNQHRFLM